MDQETTNPGMPRTDLFRDLMAVIPLGVFVGIVMAIVSNGFVFGVQWLSELRSSLNFFFISIGNFDLELGPTITLLIACFVILLVRKIFGINRWHGPADSIYAAHRTDNELDIKHGFGSTVAAFVSAGGGASVGQYGPLVHFGATMGSFLRQFFGSRVTTDVFIGCGVAAAIAAGFNAPIAGVVFAHEAILRHFSLRAMAPIAIASITASWASSWTLESEPLFLIGNIEPNLIELLPAALIAGPIFGLLAVLFMKSLRLSARVAGGYKWSPSHLLFIAALITGGIGAFVPEVLGLGGETVSSVLQGDYTVLYLFALLMLKLAVTSLCIGFGLFGGIFSPAMFIGVTAGALVGRFLASLGLIVAGPGLAICGMSAVAAAVIGAPIAGVLIILEMTMSYEYALAAMLSVVTSTLISSAIFGHSFFDRQLLDRKIDISQGRGRIEMMETPLLDVVSQDYIAIPAGSDVANSVKVLVTAGATEGYLLSNTDNGFLGKVVIHQLLTANGNECVMEFLMQNPVIVKHDASLQQAIEVASDFVGESIPVVDHTTGQMRGVVTEADLFKLYLNLQNRITDLERS